MCERCGGDKDGEKACFWRVKMCLGCGNQGHNGVKAGDRRLLEGVGVKEGETKRGENKSESLVELLHQKNIGRVLEKWLEEVGVV